MQEIHTLHLRSSKYDSESGFYQVTTPSKLCTPMLPNSIIWYWPKSSVVGKVLAMHHRL